eukprot:gene7136-14517_t
MSADSTTDPEEKEIIHEIQLSCEIAVQTLNDMLMFDKLEGGTLKLELNVVDIIPFVEDTVHPFFIQLQVGQSIVYSRGQSLRYSVSKGGSVKTGRKVYVLDEIGINNELQVTGLRGSSRRPSVSKTLSMSARKGYFYDDYTRPRSFSPSPSPIIRSSRLEDTIDGSGMKKYSNN